MITDEVRGKFEGLNLQEGDQIKLQYIENEYGQNAVQEIDRIVAYKKISAEEAKEVIDSEDGFIILDVRTPEEYTEGYIKGAVNLPNEDIKDTPPALLPDKNAKILVYCRSGNRSQEASQKLIDMGYSQVYDFGGIIDWPYETVK
ncbi:MAG: rhodanese-like domain-containing protein [Syntrophomonadaceae bacterium]|nr:rhodanese-like domain-containing protein [Syntrophomonadaceae bacterium]